MKEEQFDDLVSKLVAEPMPVVSSRLEADVWRKIRTIKAEQKRGLDFIWFLNPWGTPTAAVACIAIAVVIGFLIGALPNRPSDTVLSQAGVELSAFTEYSPFLPSTLLAPAR
jgi:hypothetical protein